MKKEMEKYINYESLKNDYKKEKIFKIKENNLNIQIINLNKIEKKNEKKKEKEINEIKLRIKFKNKIIKKK